MHDHSHSRGKNIKVAILLNVSFTIIEIIGGILTNSLAILSDALHDFGDSVVLISAWFAEKKAEQGPDAKRTFGYARVSLFSALLSGAVLTAGSIFILFQAIPRLLEPEAVYAPGMIVLAIIGIVFNGIGALRLKRGASMNEKVLTWHLLEDVLGWCAVLVGSILIYLFNIPILDPLMTIGYTLFILWGVTRRMREVSNILLQGVPLHINIDAMKKDLLAIPGVQQVHDIHVWSLEGATDVFSGHIVVDEERLADRAITKSCVNDVLKKHHIEHSTIELEDSSECSGNDCGVTLDHSRH